MIVSSQVEQIGREDGELISCRRHGLYTIEKTFNDHFTDHFLRQLREALVYTDIADFIASLETRQSDHHMLTIIAPHLM